MSLPKKLTETLLRLPEADRLDLARLLVESVGACESAGSTMDEAVRRLEELVSGGAEPLSEEEFRAEFSK